MAKIRIIQTHNQSPASTGYRVKTQTRDGQKYLVVPVVMMLEGVHNGSHGPMLHTEQELSQNVESWNGIPVTIGHPQLNGVNVSANLPNIPSVGAIYNTRWDNGKLKAEAWLHEQRITAQSPMALAHIKQKRQLDVSVGVFSDEISVSGEWNGESYVSIASNYRPDHLALLPGENGACSWADGCGVRANKENKPSNNLIPKDNEMKKEEIQVLKALAVDEVQVNEAGLRSRLEALSRLVDGMDERGNDGEYTSYHMMEEVYANYLIYRKRKKDDPNVMYYKQNYQINADDTVALTGEPVQVRKDVNYVQVNAGTEIQSNINLNQEETQMSKTPSQCLVAKVDKVINHKLTQFEEADREWLLTQSEATLERMLPVEVTPEETPDPVVNREQAINVLRDSFKKPEDFINILPDEMRDQMRSGLKLHQDHRARLISAITANSEVWTPEELKAMDTSMLTKIATTAKQVVDYSGNGGQEYAEPVQVNSDEEEPMLPLN